MLSILLIDLSLFPSPYYAQQTQQNPSYWRIYMHNPFTDFKKSFDSSVVCYGSIDEWMYRMNRSGKLGKLLNCHLGIEYWGNEVKMSVKRWGSSLVQYSIFLPHQAYGFYHLIEPALSVCAFCGSLCVYNGCNYIS